LVIGERGVVAAHAGRAERTAVPVAWVDAPPVGVTPCATAGSEGPVEVAGSPLLLVPFADIGARPAVRAALTGRDVDVVGAPRVAGIDLRGRIFALIDFVRF